MAFRPSLPPFILESAALRSQSAWTLMAQALLTGLVSGGVIGLFRWLYTIINGAVRAHMAGFLRDALSPSSMTSWTRTIWPGRIPSHRPRWP